jgi:2-dehydro-3-deoxygluconokinase
MTPVANRLTSKSGDDKRGALRPGRSTRPRTILCQGELLLRLASGAPGRLFQDPLLRFDVGGAEANVAVGLVRLGHHARMLSALPDTLPGDAVVEALRAQGVDTRNILRRPGRMGLYFLDSAAAGRAGGIVYDRADSVFARTALPRPAIATALQGVDWVHTSGITSALGPVPRQGLHLLWRAASAAGIGVSFDCNFRPSLWQGRLVMARRELSAGLSAARVAFADARVLALVLGDPAPREGDEAAFARLSRKAFSRFPGLQLIAATARIEHSAGRHELRGMVATRDGVESCGPLVAEPVVDRIGTGDAFAAAMLLASLEGLSPATALSLAVAACVLKHSFPGDFNLATRAQIEALAAGRAGGIRR